MARGSLPRYPCARSSPCIGRDDEELKIELGLARFEGRSWRGFLIREKAAIPPPSGSWRRQKPSLSNRPRPRGAPGPYRATQRKLDRDDTTKTHSRVGENPHALPVLPGRPAKAALSGIVVTQENWDHRSARSCAAHGRVLPRRSMRGRAQFLSGRCGRSASSINCSLLSHNNQLRFIALSIQRSQPLEGVAQGRPSPL
jgi:hypothetical protein